MRKRPAEGEEARKGRERNQTSPRGTLTCARVRRRYGTDTLYSPEYTFEYSVHTHMHQTVDEMRRTGGEARNSVHSEAFEREVCSACTLHSRAVHNSYCPSSRCTRLRQGTAVPSRLAFSSPDRWIPSIARTAYVPPFEPATRMRSTHPQIMHGHLFRRRTARLDLCTTIRLRNALNT